ncbi:uncharacterized protein DUF3600 [Thermolongibacillus altinsuensis]|jgi:hypothetical protein|uniref:Uncharacterized protein DUF3600 n=1 Tax=Thermolongibacillus altinsuensis TaxID=575256 RepID=A0A4R1QHH5_9BACL|nr:DUF3600 domain-containing protein [Thermolongibacillus altinsuensis]TCL49328.1 uncharacterized protein DUF3600 [Thermolongibacillus altinsuensis]GMB10144.1 hypothetical protein B1no1_28540 [Thermolongibacillus altinsuensis]
MNLENRLKESLQEKGKELVPPPELKTKVMSSITTVSGKMKKRLVAGILTASLLIPASVFASQSFLADELYGSFENLKKHIASATMESYLLLSAKLSQAKGELEQEDYDRFKELLHVVTSSKMEYGDPYGNIDYDQIPSEKVDEIKQAMMEVQPYFDKLNGQKSSKEVLTPEEYETYIEALMTYEKVLVQSGINPSSGPIDVEMIPPNLQEEFLKAREFIEYVDKQVR